MRLLQKKMMKQNMFSKLFLCEYLSVDGSLVDPNPQEFSNIILVSTQPTSILPDKKQYRRGLFDVSLAETFSLAHEGHWILVSFSRDPVIRNCFLLWLIPQTEWP